MWYREYGWKSNPFTIKPNPTLVGVEDAKKKLLGYVTSKDVCHLSGEVGMGKTSLLLWLNEQLTGLYNPVYLVASYLHKPDDLYAGLKEKRSLVDRILFRKLPSNMVLLLDEAQNLDGKLGEIMKSLFDEEKIVSAVLVSSEPKLNNLSESLKDRIGRRELRLTRLSLEQGITLLKTRLKGQKNPFQDDDAISELVRHGDFSPRKILGLCELVCQQCLDKARLGEPIKKTDVGDILGDLDSKPSKLEAPVTNLVNGKHEAEYTSPSNGKQHLTKLEGLGQLSQMQMEIVTSISKSPKSMEELAKTLKSTVGSVGKQLSVLSSPIPEKNIGQPIVQIVSQKRPKQYGLTDWATKQLKHSKN